MDQHVASLGIMDFVLISTFLVTVIIAAITAFGIFKHKEPDPTYPKIENSNNANAEEYANSLLQILKFQSNDLLRIHQNTESLIRELKNEVIGRMEDLISRESRKNSEEHREIRDDISEIRKDIIKRYHE